MNRSVGPRDSGSRGLASRLLDGVEKIGNRLPDPAMLFVWALVITWLFSAFLSQVSFEELDPRSKEPIKIINQLTATSLVGFLSNMVKTFVEFPPLGLVLVAMLGVGVAEHAGLINAALKGLLRLTPQMLLTPMLILVGILSHSAGDSGHVLVIPLGGAMFAAAGRHPLLGITTAFAGVSGGFSANFIPSALDPLLQGFTQKAAQIIDPNAVVNPLCNWFFMSATCLVITCVGWYVSDWIIEPRLARVPIDPPDFGSTQATASNAASGTNIATGSNTEQLGQLNAAEVRGLKLALGVMAAGLAMLVVSLLPGDSPFRSSEGKLAGHDAPLMKSIIPLIFFFFFVPGVVYGYTAGTIRHHRDVVKGMNRAMESVTYYLVMAFFASQFTAVFTQSNVGVLIAVKGANALQAINMPPQFTIVGIIALSSLVNLVIGSASAKWALLSPIFVPMLMSLGLSAELTQVAYRIGDSSTNIISPLFPYFPLVVVYAQRYVQSTGIGTMISLMLPYSIAFMIAWTLLLLVFWSTGIPLGIDAPYVYKGAQ